MSELVSIITPVYNNANTIVQTVHSVMAQTYPYWELILVDDASTDEVLPLLQRLALEDERERIQVYALGANRGAAGARNEGILHAKGRFIAFLDADDLWEGEKLERQVEFSMANAAAITHTSYKWVDQKGVATGKVIHARERLTYDDMLDYNYIGCLTGMYDTEVTGKKYFMPDIAKRQDYGLWLHIMRDGHEAFGLDTVLAQYRTGGASLSSNKWESALYNWRVLRELEGLSRLEAVKHFLRYALKGLQKYR
ncbi:MAG: glycosyltransferase family 2 protein [Flavobacteriales bacterium]|nr:glycosyltransferase family 2 protein [Flavobacteriales bacterium]